MIFKSKSLLYSCVSVGIIFSFTFLAFEIGSVDGIHRGMKDGYIQGQIDLVRQLKRELPDYSDTVKSIGKDLHHVKDIKGITIYVYKKNSVTTFAIAE